MIIGILTMPKIGMERLLQADPLLLQKHFAISICDPDETRPHPGEHPRLLNLSFCDVGPDEIPEDMRTRYPSMSVEDANRVIAFILRCNALDARGHLLIHCAAGISRSGAVAQFAMELLNRDAA